MTTVWAVPTFRRPDTLARLTLSLLHTRGVPAGTVQVWLSDPDEQPAYAAAVEAAGLPQPDWRAGARQLQHNRAAIAAAQPRQSRGSPHPPTQGGHPMTAPQRHDPALAEMRAMRATELRALGYTYAAIAASYLPCMAHRADPTHDGGPLLCPTCVRPLYSHRSDARKAVLRHLAKEYAAGAEQREQLRAQQLAQIDMLLRRAMPSAVGGDWEAMRAATRLLDRRARLLGLDAPTRVEITSELDSEIEQLLAQLAELPPTTERSTP